MIFTAGTSLKIGIVAIILTGLVSYHYFDKKMAVNAAIAAVEAKYTEVFSVMRRANEKNAETQRELQKQGEQKYAELKKQSELELVGVNAKLDRLRTQLASARTRANQDSPATTGIDGTGDYSVPEQLVEEIRYLASESERLRNKVTGLQEYIKSLEPYMEQ